MLQPLVDGGTGSLQQEWGASAIKRVRCNCDDVGFDYIFKAQTISTVLVAS